MRRRVSASVTTTTRQPWRLPPLGAKRALSSTRSSTWRDTGSSVKRRVEGAQRISSYSSSDGKLSARPVAGAGHPTAHQELGDLDGIRGRAFAQVVAHHPHVERAGV